MTAHDGGPAFPLPDLVAAGLDRSARGGAPGHPGMSLLAYISTHAMAGFLMQITSADRADALKKSASARNETPNEHIARQSVMLARAMIAELEKGQ